MSDQPRLSPKAVAALVLDELLSVGAHERLAIVRDDDSLEEVIAAFLAAAQERQLEFVLLHQPSRSAERKNVLNAAIARALEHVDAMVALTMSGGSPVYAAETTALKAAGRLRFMSMVMRDLDVLTGGGATADYRALLVEGRRLRDIWSASREIHVTSAAGTDIRAPIAWDHVLVECGYATEPGTSAAFSDGEVSSRPLEGQAEGVIVIDGPGDTIGIPSAPIAIEVVAGRVRAIHGTSEAADTLRRIVDTVEDADNLAEFGIGLNPCCRLNGKFEEMKKARGQVHVALGDNIVFGGTCQSAVHMDLLVLNPTVHLDDRRVVREGVVTLD